jgi:Flp pilus assembly protein TadD
MSGSIAQMTEEQIADHDRFYREATALIRGELLLQGNPVLPKPSEPVRLRLERALQLFSDVLQLNPQNWAAMWLEGKTHQRLGDLNSAIACFLRAHDLNPSLADIAREASLCLMDLGRSQEAVYWARNAVEAQPQNQGLHANLAVALLLDGKPHEADASVDDAAAGTEADAVTRNLKTIIKHFIDTGQKPPTTTASLQEYWRQLSS